VRNPNSKGKEKNHERSPVVKGENRKGGELLHPSRLREAVVRGSNETDSGQDEPRHLRKDAAGVGCGALMGSRCRKFAEKETRHRIWG